MRLWLVRARCFDNVLELQPGNVPKQLRLYELCKLPCGDFLHDWLKHLLGLLGRGVSAEHRLIDLCLMCSWNICWRDRLGGILELRCLHRWDLLGARLKCLHKLRGRPVPSKHWLVGLLDLRCRELLGLGCWELFELRARHLPA